MDSYSFWSHVIDACERLGVPERLTRMARRRKMLAWCRLVTAKRKVDA